MSDTKVYRLLRGKKTIAGKTYQAGDVIALTEREAGMLRYSVELVGEKKSEMRVSAPLAHSVLDGPVPEVVTHLSGVSSLAELDSLEDQERQGKGRRTVFRALDDRRSELSEE